MNKKELFTEKLYSREEGLTFDDVLIVPASSNVIPAEVDTATYLTSDIRLQIPVLSAAMDTVTKSRLAIAIAQLGGIGIIHRNLTTEMQVEEVKKVKRFENIFITNPITLSPDKTIKDAKDLMAKYSVSGVPIVDDKGKLKGIITKRDMGFFDSHTSDNTAVKSIMTTREQLIVSKNKVGLSEAGDIMRKNRVEKLPIVDKNDVLIGLITLKDISKIAKFPGATKDSKGRLRVGAAVGTGAGEIERIKQLIDAEVDVLVVDTAHGHSDKVLKLIRQLRSEFPKQNIIGGNIATGEAAEALIKAGVNAVKVGIGPGSICTTRVVAGVGMPQFSAIMETYSVAHKSNTPIIADGGIKFSGDIAKAIAGGADTIMIGNLLAGTTESPGEFIIYKGRRYKSYRGMGSLGAMVEGSKARYFQDEYEPQKLVPEGIEGRVPYKGDLKDVIYQLIGGLRAAMGYSGASSISQFKTKTRFIKITSASLRESHPHDVIITKESPNYMVDTDNF